MTREARTGRAAVGATPPSSQMSRTSVEEGALAYGTAKQGLLDFDRSKRKEHDAKLSKIFDKQEQVKEERMRRVDQRRELRETLCGPEAGIGTLANEFNRLKILRRQGGASAVVDSSYQSNVHSIMQELFDDTEELAAHLHGQHQDDSTLRRPYPAPIRYLTDTEASEDGKDDQPRASTHSMHDPFAKLLAEQGEEGLGQVLSTYAHAVTEEAQDGSSEVQAAADRSDAAALVVVPVPSHELRARGSSAASHTETGSQPALDVSAIRCGSTAGENSPARVGELRAVALKEKEWYEYDQKIRMFREVVAFYKELQNDDLLGDVKVLKAENRFLRKERVELYQKLYGRYLKKMDPVQRIYSEEEEDLNAKTEQIIEARDAIMREELAREKSKFETRETFLREQVRRLEKDSKALKALQVDYYAAVRKLEKLESQAMERCDRDAVGGQSEEQRKAQHLLNLEADLVAKDATIDQLTTNYEALLKRTARYNDLVRATLHQHQETQHEALVEMEAVARKGLASAVSDPTTELDKLKEKVEKLHSEKMEALDRLYSSRVDMGPVEAFMADAPVGAMVEAASCAGEGLTDASLGAEYDVPVAPLVERVCQGFYRGVAGVLKILQDLQPHLPQDGVQDVVNKLPADCAHMMTEYSHSLKDALDTYIAKQQKVQMAACEKFAARALEEVQNRRISEAPSHVSLRSAPAGEGSVRGGSSVHNSRNASLTGSQAGGVETATTATQTTEPYPDGVHMGLGGVTTPVLPAFQIQDYSALVRDRPQSRPQSAALPPTPARRSIPSPLEADMPGAPSVPSAPETPAAAEQDLPAGDNASRPGSAPKSVFCAFAPSRFQPDLYMGIEEDFDDEDSTPMAQTTGCLPTPPSAPTAPRGLPKSKSSQRLGAEKGAMGRRRASSGVFGKQDLPTGGAASPRARSRSMRQPSDTQEISTPLGRRRTLVTSSPPTTPRDAQRTGTSPRASPAAGPLPSPRRSPKAHSSPRPLRPSRSCESLLDMKLGSADVPLKRARSTSILMSTPSVDAAVGSPTSPDAISKLTPDEIVQVTTPDQAPLIATEPPDDIALTKEPSADVSEALNAASPLAEPTSPQGVVLSPHTSPGTPALVPDDKKPVKRRGSKLPAGPGSPQAGATLKVKEEDNRKRSLRSAVHTVSFRQRTRSMIKKDPAESTAKTKRDKEKDKDKDTAATSSTDTASAKPSAPPRAPPARPPSGQRRRHVGVQVEDISSNFHRMQLTGGSAAPNGSLPSLPPVPALEPPPMADMGTQMSPRVEAPLVSAPLEAVVGSPSVASPRAGGKGKKPRSRRGSFVDGKKAKPADSIDSMIAREMAEATPPGVTIAVPEFRRQAEEQAAKRAERQKMVEEEAQLEQALLMRHGEKMDALEREARALQHEEAATAKRRHARQVKNFVAEEEALRWEVEGELEAFLRRTLRDFEHALSAMATEEAGALIRTRTSTQTQLKARLKTEQEDDDRESQEFQQQRERRRKEREAIFAEEKRLEEEELSRLQKRKEEAEEMKLKEENDLKLERERQARRVAERLDAEEAELRAEEAMYRGIEEKRKQMEHTLAREATMLAEMDSRRRQMQMQQRHAQHASHRSFLSGTETAETAVPWSSGKDLMAHRSSTTMRHHSGRLSVLSAFGQGDEEEEEEEDDTRMMRTTAALEEQLMGAHDIILEAQAVFDAYGAQSNREVEAERAAWQQKSTAAAVASRAKLEERDAHIIALEEAARVSRYEFDQELLACQPAKEEVEEVKRKAKALHHDLLQLQNEKGAKVRQHAKQLQMAQDAAVKKQEEMERRFDAERSVLKSEIEDAKRNVQKGETHLANLKATFEKSMKEAKGTKDKAVAGMKQRMKAAQEEKLNENNARWKEREQELLAEQRRLGALVKVGRGAQMGLQNLQKERLEEIERLKDVFKKEKAALNGDMASLRKEMDELQKTAAKLHKDAALGKERERVAAVQLEKEERGAQRLRDDIAALKKQHADAEKDHEHRVGELHEHIAELNGIVQEKAETDRQKAITAHADHHKRLAAQKGKAMRDLIEEKNRTARYEETIKELERRLREEAKARLSADCDEESWGTHGKKCLLGFFQLHKKLLEFCADARAALSLRCVLEEPPDSFWACQTLMAPPKDPEEGLYDEVQATVLSVMQTDINVLHDLRAAVREHAQKVKAMRAMARRPTSTALPDPMDAALIPAIDGPDAVAPDDAPLTPPRDRGTPTKVRTFDFELSGSHVSPNNRSPSAAAATRLPQRERPTSAPSANWPFQGTPSLPSPKPLNAQPPHMRPADPELMVSAHPHASTAPAPQQRGRVPHLADHHIRPLSSLPNRQPLAIAGTPSATPPLQPVTGQGTPSPGTVGHVGLVAPAAAGAGHATLKARRKEAARKDLRHQRLQLLHSGKRARSSVPDMRVAHTTPPTRQLPPASKYVVTDHPHYR